MVNTSMGLQGAGAEGGLETSEGSFSSDANVLSNFSHRAKIGIGGACSCSQYVLSRLGPLPVPALPIAVGEGVVGGRGPADLPQLGDCLLKEKSTGHVQTVFRFFPFLRLQTY